MRKGESFKFVVFDDDTNRMKIRSKMMVMRDINEGLEVIDVDDIDVKSLPRGRVQQSAEVVIRKRQNEDEDLYQEQLKRHRKKSKLAIQI